jgi:hypothetical protein
LAAFLILLKSELQILVSFPTPHYTTLQKSSAWPHADKQFRALSRSTLQRVMRRRKRVRHAAADSWGFASRYYVRRRAKGQKDEPTAQPTFYTCSAWRTHKLNYWRGIGTDTSLMKCNSVSG